MARLALVSKYIFILTILVLFSSDSHACHKKKKKKVVHSTTDSRKAVSDSSHIVRAPGVQNKHQLDSLKAAKMKDKRNFSMLVVSFISLGAGIDQEAKSELDHLLQEFLAQSKCKLNAEMRAWGREGENDYCFSTSDQQCMKNLIEAIQKKFAGNKRVLIQPNAICRDPN